MRALCEGCGKPQPPDWKAGDLCSHCGKSVRHDVRCYWCAKWTPAAKFCRSCGAAVVEEKFYGAARMLKDAGTDRFTVPKQLQEFDPDQIENFSRIYQRHAVAVARHVDELRFLERFLHNRTFSAELEDQLVPQLPWPEETLARMSAPTPPPGDDPAVVRAIQQTTPFPTTKALALLVRLAKQDGDVYREATSVFSTSDPLLKDEAVLALTGWRVVHTWGRPRNLEREMIEALERSPCTLEAGVRLGLLGKGNSDVLHEALSSPDPDTAFCAALVLGEVDRLQAALKGDDLQKTVAGNKLISLGVIRPVIQEIPRSTEEIQQQLVDSLLRRKEPVPEASEALLEIVEKTEDRTLRERAVRLLCRRLHPAWVLRIARKAGKERSIYQDLLQASDLQPESAVELGDFLIAEGLFGMHQYGLSHVAEKGVMPRTFVPSRFGSADAAVQKELLHFAEAQIKKELDESLHRFLMNVAFGPHSHEVRAAAWWALHRTYRSGGEYRGEGPLRLTAEQLVRFFGSVAAFVPRLAAVLRSRDTLKEVGYYEMIATVLKTADAGTIAEMQADANGCNDLVDALLEALGGDYWPNTLEAMVLLASQLGGDPRWRDRVLARLRNLGKKGSYHYDKAVRRLELARHGIPEEADWKTLPEDFVPDRFWKADPEGRREFLKVADQQLIHGNRDQRSPVLSRFLLKAALAPDDPELAGQAMHILRDRTSSLYQRFRLKRDEVEKAYGSFSEFVAALPQALKRALGSDRREEVDFYTHLLSRPEKSDAALLAGEGEAGEALIHALLEVAAAPKGDTPQTALRRDALRFLGEAGGHSAWKKAVVKALERLHAAPDTDQKAECEMALRKLKPPKPPRAPKPVQAHPREEEPPPVSYGAPEPDDEVVDDAAKQKIAEKMGNDLQQAMFKLMAGPGTPEEKMREGQRMSEEFQAAIKKLYGA